MKLKQSQLSYLCERGRNYDRKYRMFELLIDKIPDQLNLVLELFGGVGIQSYYLQNNKKISEHIAIDCDPNCYEIAKKLLPDITHINCNSFTYTSDKKIDLLVCDSVFNKKEFENITDLVSKFDFEYLILTVTGVFNVRFNKNLTYNQYWTNLISDLQKKGLYASHIVYSSDFGLMLIQKDKAECSEIERLNNNNLSTKWRKYTEVIKNGNKEI